MPIVEQKYQNNRQIIHRRSAGLFVVVVADLPPGDPSARLERFTSADSDRHHRAAAVETLAGASPDAVKLGDRSPQMATCPSPDRRDRLPRCFQSRFHRHDYGLLHPKPDGRIPWSHSLYKRGTPDKIHRADHGLQHRPADDNAVHRVARHSLSTLYCERGSLRLRALAACTIDTFVDGGPHAANINIYL